MSKKEIIKKTEKFVKDVLKNDGSGHDWWHIFRVRKLAVQIAKEEMRGDLFIIELAALLHDVADRKFNDGNTKKGLEKVRIFLSTLSIENSVTFQICNIIDSMSFSASFLKKGKRRIMVSPEAQIVQDADRLDAIGAIGIARAFAYGGSKGREIYNPTIAPIVPTSKRQYIQSTSHTINHFYEKLLLIKKVLNTETAKRIANKRHIFMKTFLAEFRAEWEEKLV